MKAAVRKASISFGARRLDFARDHAGRLGIGFMLLALITAIQLAYPRLIGFFIDHWITHNEVRRLGLALIATAAVLAVQAIGTGVRGYLFSSTGSMLVAEIRELLFSSLMRREMEFFDFHDVGELTNRLAADVQELRNVLTTNLASFLQAALVSAGGVVMLICLSPRLSLLIAILIPPVVWSARWIGMRVRAKSKLRQAQLANCGHIAQEVLSNIRLVHASSRQDAEQRRYASATRAARDFSLTCDRLFSGLEGLETFVQNMALLITLWFGARLIPEHALTVGQLVSFVLYAGMTASSATIMTSLWGEWMGAVGATERVFELINEVPRTSITHPIAVPPLRGAIEFDSVFFSYPSRPTIPALNGFNLIVAPEERIALIGPSGAGKTTVTNLLLGFYKPNQGLILVDGIDLAQAECADLRRQMAIVEQEPALFSGTILDNIRYGAVSDRVGEKEALEAAREANVHEFITRFPLGYDTLVGGRGMQLSGGQKQRVAIARALLRNPRVLILDEATSALDSEEERKVQSALRTVMRRRTTIIIAHRSSTVTYADRIVVMNRGCVVQTGTHRELAEDASGLYFRLMGGQIPHLEHSASDCSASRM